MGALFLPISERFDTTRPVTAFVQSITLGLVISAVVVGSLVERYGPWKMCLVGTVTTVAGLGGGFFATCIVHLYIVAAVSGFGITVMLLCGVVAVESVTEGRAMSVAVALNNSSIGFGALVYPHLLTFLTNNYTLNGAYLILAGVFCNNIVLVLLTLSVPARLRRSTNKEVFESNETDGTACVKNTTGVVKSSLYSIKATFLKITSITYVLTWTAFCLSIGVVNGYLIICVDVYISLGFTEYQGITSMIFYNLGNVSAAMIGAILKQFRPVNTFTIPFAFSCCGSFGMVLTYFAVSVPMAYTGALFLGLTEGVITGTLLILAEIVPKDYYGTAFGIILTSLALFSISSGPIIGALRDASGSHTITVLVIGITLLLAASLYIAAGVAERKSRNKTLRLGSLTSTKSTRSFDNQTFSQEVQSECVSDLYAGSTDTRELQTACSAIPP